LGEAAPNVRYGEDWRTVMAGLDRLEPLLDPGAAGGPFDAAAALDRIEAAASAGPAARAAGDSALHDLVARGQGVPLWRLLGADPGAMPRTSFSIGLDAVPARQEKAREAEAFPVLKIKLGRGDDRAVVEGIREVTDKPLYVDANE